MNETFRTGRRRLLAQAGAAAVAATMLSAGFTRSTAGQEATPDASTAPDAGEAHVRFAVGEAEIVVRIAGNPTARDFASMLPLTLEFEDFSGMEKISYLPRELDTGGSTGHTPANGDLIYFVPWGNLGFFYDADRRDPSFDDRVILIGSVVTGFEFLDELETAPVSVDVVPTGATPEASPEVDV